MTVKQIKAYIEELGYSLNTWSDFKKIPAIRLYSITSLLTDDTRLIRFNSSKNRLEFVIGKYRDGVFIDKYGNTSDYKPCGYISFSAIAGFIRSDIATNVYYSRRPFYVKDAE